MIDKEIREKNSSVSVRDYIDFNALFGRSAPVWLDVGCGKGVFSVELAKDIRRRFLSPLSGSETSWWKELCVPCARIFPICAFCARARNICRVFSAVQR